MKLTKIFGIVLSLHLGVILLVMFQPGCQSAKMKDKPVVEAEPVAPEKISETVAPDAGFNSGVKDISAAKPEPVEFSAPTRPKAGGLIVPGHGEVHAKPLPPILEETETYSPPVNLRPTGLSIYKVERGTPFGELRERMVLHYLLCLVPIPISIRMQSSPLGRKLWFQKKAKALLLQQRAQHLE